MTGVQTCALPISNRRATEAENRLDAFKYAVNDVFGTAELHRKMAQISPLKGEYGLAGGM